MCESSNTKKAIISHIIDNNDIIVIIVVLRTTSKTVYICMEHKHLKPPCHVIDKRYDKC